jgi:hypothetical protein
MPMLYSKDRAKMLGPTDRYCPKCHQRIFRNYCREHDVFFDICCCGIENPDDNHENHRNYKCQENDGDCHSGPQVRFAHGDKLHSFAVKKTP